MVVLVGLSAVANATLIYNGSFESGNNPPTTWYRALNAGSTDIDGWSISGDTTAVPVVDWIGAGYWQAADGQMSLDLAGKDNGVVFTTTSFDTIIGQTYLLTFWMAGNPNDGDKLKKLLVNVDNG